MAHRPSTLEFVSFSLPSGLRATTKSPRRNGARLCPLGQQTNKQSSSIQLNSGTSMAMTCWNVPTIISCISEEQSEKYRICENWEEPYDGDRRGHNYEGSICVRAIL